MPCRRITLAPFLALALLLLGGARSPGFADGPALLTMPDGTEATGAASPAEDGVSIEPGADGAVPLPGSQPPGVHPFAQPPGEVSDGPPDGGEAMPESDSYFSKFRWLGLHHSSTDGRNVGMGIPLTGTSWLNRPYYFGGQIGTVWLTRPINSDLTTDTDTFGGVFAGLPFRFIL